MNLKLYNTLTRKKEIFDPIDPKNVRLYVCGPTVYDYAHIGNARSIVVFDILYRILLYIYGPSHVLYVRNITDIDDKINMRAKKDFSNISLNSAIHFLTEKMIRKFQEDTNYLCCLDPNIQPRVTDHLDAIREMIEHLLNLGHAYVSSNHVFFSVSSIKNNPLYGELSCRLIKNTFQKTKKNISSCKKNLLDFVLWKPSEENDPGWISPGNIPVKGRPGWHIECSAMATHHLLKPFGGGFFCKNSKNNIFDIHGGGIDLLFPHHENEIAQSCCAFGTNRMVNVWMHNGFLQVEGKKMSKSLGNFITIDEILHEKLLHFSTEIHPKIGLLWSGLAMRLSILQTNYREPLNWTKDRLLKSSKELYRWYKLLYQRNYFESPNENSCFSIMKILLDDLNTSQAIYELRRFYKDRCISSLGCGMKFLGLLQNDLIINVKKFFFETNNYSSIKNLKIEYLIQKRLQALCSKNWIIADDIRNYLKEKGIILIDKKNPDTGDKFTDWYFKK